jgi:hypothetical protein
MFQSPRVRVEPGPRGTWPGAVSIRTRKLPVPRHLTVPRSVNSRSSQRFGKFDEPDAEAAPAPPRIVASAMLGSEQLRARLTDTGGV